MAVAVRTLGQGCLLCQVFGGSVSGILRRDISEDNRDSGQDIHGGLFTDSVTASKTPSQGALEEGCE